MNAGAPISNAQCAAMTRFNVKEAKELMNHIYKIQEIVFENGEKMPEGIYCELMKSLLEMADGEFYLRIEAQAKKASRRKADNRVVATRNMVQQNPDRFCCCPLCDRPLAKKSMRSHLRSQLCKDNHYLKKAVAPAEVLANITDSEINDIMVEFYETNEPHEVASVPIEEEPPAHWQ